VRVNAWDTEWTYRDVIEVVEGASERLDELMLPKVETAADETIKGKPAATLKVTGPDGKDFTLYFDKESGLPVRLVAKVAGWMGEEYVQESTFSDYKDFGGFKKASKVSVKRDGEDFLQAEVTDFKVLDKVPAETFAEPK
jgi:hypothetical protein